MCILGDTLPDETTDFTLAGEFSKLDEDRHLAFGLASAVEVAGEPIEDSQGDVLNPAPLEKAVYEYNLISRDADEMHTRSGVGDLIESFYITPEKFQAIGKRLEIDMPEDPPQAWWVGFRVSDEEVWAKVKDGTYGMFSIKGRGKRRDLADAA